LIKVHSTSLEEVRLIELESFEDHRGEYVEIYNEHLYRDAGISIRFIQDDYSASTRNVLRGIHGDAETWKLITCPYGKFYLVVVDCREETASFGKWESFVLSDRNHRQVLIPPNFGNGHLILSNRAIFHYKQSTNYDPSKQFSHRWDDPRFGVWWPVKSPILSRRDELGHYVSRRPQGMIITRTPFRISFFGGGTDYPVWYRENGGAVLSTTINKYCYINCRYLPPFFNMKYLIRYSTREETKTIEEIMHPAVRECLHFMNIDQGIEMVHTSDIPARSGIGSSSSFTVGLLSSLYSLTGRMATKRKLAREAIHIEQNMIRESVGSQDQVIVAFGGLNKIEFGGDQEFYVYPVTIGNGKIESLQDHLMLFFTGFSRNASDIAAKQIRNTAAKGGN
jgi:dTDP-4-dehydrorhamnose 3,5-epimerase